MLSYILGSGAVSITWDGADAANAPHAAWLVRTFDELPPEAVAIRTAVFMDEQGFEDEFDATDSEALHLVGYLDEKPAACARLYWNDEHECYVVGRIAVNRELRGQSLGAKILQAAEEEARARGGVRCELSAQVRAGGFYEKQGYARCGAEHLDEGCPHVWMGKDL